MQRRAVFLLLVLCIAYWCTKWAKHHYHLYPFFRDHFTDLLFIPMQLTLALIVVRFLRRDSSLRISILQIVLTVIAMIALFEWYLPHYSEKKELYTGDPADAAMYVLGGIFFIIYQQFVLTENESVKSC